MSTINIDSIVKKAEKVMSSSKYQKMIDKKVDEAIVGGSSSLQNNVTEAAEKFIDVMCDEIQGQSAASGDGGLGETAVDALSNLDSGSPVKIGRFLYQVPVYFTNNLHRESLAPKVYDGVDNIAALLNTGYTASHCVYGVWNGHGTKRRKSLTHRSGTHFIENAIENYMGNYAATYGIANIETDSVYK